MCVTLLIGYHAFLFHGWDYGMAPCWKIVRNQKGIGRRSSLCLVYIQELTRNAYDNLNYRSEKRLKRMQHDSTMALISFTKVAREAGVISFWLVYSSNIIVCEALALSTIRRASSSQHNCGLSENTGTIDGPPAADDMQLSSEQFLPQ